MSRASTVKDLRAKVNRLERKKREIDEQVAALHTTIRVFEDDAEDDTTESRGDELRDAIFSILQDESGPLHRTVIYERVVGRGLAVLGKNPVNTLGSHLSLDGRFLNVGRGLWELADPAKTAPLRGQRLHNLAMNAVDEADDVRDNVRRLVENVARQDGEQETEDMPEGTVTIQQPQPRPDRTALNASRLASVGNPVERR